MIRNPQFEMYYTGRGYHVLVITVSQGKIKDLTSSG